MATNSTFPELLATTDFSVPFVDFDSVVDPKCELPAEQYNTIVANIVAVSNVLPMFWVVVSSAGAYVAGAWSLSTAAATKIVPFKASTGVYYVGFDNDDTKHPSDPNTVDLSGTVWCAATPLSSSARFISSYYDSNFVALVSSFDAAGVAADSGFLLMVYKGTLCQSAPGKILSLFVLVAKATRK